MGSFTVVGTKSWLTDLKRAQIIGQAGGKDAWDKLPLKVTLDHEKLLSDPLAKTQIIEYPDSTNPPSSEYMRDFKGQIVYKDLNGLDGIVDESPVGDENGDIPELNLNNEAPSKPSFQSIVVPAKTKSFILPLALVVLIAGFLIFKNR